MLSQGAIGAIPGELYPYVSSVNSGVQTGTATTRTIPLPPVKESGDMLICFISGRETNFTWPSGWTEMEDRLSGGFAGGTWAYRISDGTESGNITITLSSGSYFTTSVSIAIKNYAIGFIPEFGVAVDSGGAGTTINPPTVTVSGTFNKNLFIAAAFSLDGGGGVDLSSYPTNYTANQTHILSATMMMTSIAGRQVNAQTDDPGVFTYIGGGQYRWVNTIVIRGKNT